MTDEAIKSIIHKWVLNKIKIPRAVEALGVLLVRPTGFEPEKSHYFALNQLIFCKNR